MLDKFLDYKLRLFEYALERFQFEDFVTVDGNCNAIRPTFAGPSVEKNVAATLVKLFKAHAF